MKTATTAIALALALPLSGTARAAPQPHIYVRAELYFPLFTPISARAINAVVPPRFSHATGLRIVSYDSDDRELASYARADGRFPLLEGQARVPHPDGTAIPFSVLVVPDLRRMRVFDARGMKLLEYDLGPTLVAACAAHDLPTDLCATFDSDGDGCRDIVDDDPLAPEMIPPSISGNVAPRVLWPANRTLRTVTATVSATDNCTGSPTLTLVSVSSSDPEQGLTNGDIGPDIVGAAIGTFDTSFQLRAERWPGPGSLPRIYTIVYRATDRAANGSLLNLQVKVPHNLGAQGP